jgi:hypothetical protein
MGARVSKAPSGHSRHELSAEGRGDQWNGTAAGGIKHKRLTESAAGALTLTKGRWRTGELQEGRERHCTSGGLRADGLAATGATSKSSPDGPPMRKMLKQWRIGFTYVVDSDRVERFKQEVAS